MVVWKLSIDSFARLAIYDIVNLRLSSEEEQLKSLKVQLPAPPQEKLPKKLFYIYFSFFVFLPKFQFMR